MTSLSKHINSRHEGRIQPGMVEDLYGRGLYYCQTNRVWVAPNQVQTHLKSHVCDKLVWSPHGSVPDLGRVVPRDEDEEEVVEVEAVAASVQRSRSSLLSLPLRPAAREEVVPQAEPAPQEIRPAYIGDTAPAMAESEGG